VDAFVPALEAARGGTLVPDARVEIRRLRPDGYQVPGGPPEMVGPQADVVFPVHIRTASIKAGGNPPGPDRALFAEVYWADLSRIREGLLNSILALLSTIFLIRFITDQAAVMPRQPEAGPANRARGSARWLRAALYGSSWLLNGPLAALCVLLAGAVAVEHLVIPRLPRLEISPPHLMIALGLAGGILRLAFYRHGRRADWGSTWTRVWGALAWLGFVFAASVLVLEYLPTPVQDHVDAVLAGWVGVPPRAIGEHGLPAPAPARPFPHIHGPVLLLAAIEAVFALITFAIVVALVPLVIATSNAPKHWRPALWASYGAALVQIALWMLIVPGLALFAIASVVKDTDRRGLRRLFSSIEGDFALFLLVAMIIGAVACAVWMSRSRWAGKYRGTYQYPDPSGEVARLIVNVLIIVSIIGMTALASVTSVVAAVWDLGFPTGLGAGAGMLAVALFTGIFSYFGTGLHNGLHILNDVINHFYRPHDRFPWPWGPEDRPTVRQFKIQQDIEARFRAVLKEVLDDPQVTRLSVVSHSQGTIIAVDVLSLAGQREEYRDWLKNRLNEVGKLDLITMGSPLRHLYQHYFPERYTPLTEGWHGLEDSLNSWVNVYRIDDYIGTYVEVPVPPAPPWGSSNRPIHSGGHTAYWDQPAVFRAVIAKEPHALPG
jgi:hypothetical protein